MPTVQTDSFWKFIETSDVSLVPFQAGQFIIEDSGDIYYDPTTGTTVADRAALVVGADLDAKQDKNDSTLKTTSKAVVGAINELVDRIKSELTDKLGAQSGIATLGADSKVPTAQLPDSIIGSVSYQGVWNAADGATGEGDPIPDAAKANKGWYYITTTPGEWHDMTFEGGDWLISDGTSWSRVDTSCAINTVNGKTGNVTITAADVGLGNVTNESKATMFTSPTFTGTTTLPVLDIKKADDTTSQLKIDVSGAAPTITGSDAMKNAVNTWLGALTEVETPTLQDVLGAGAVATMASKTYEFTGDAGFNITSQDSNYDYSVDYDHDVIHFSGVARSGSSASNYDAWYTGTHFELRNGGNDEGIIFRLENGDVKGNAETKAAFNTWLGTDAIPTLNEVVVSGNTIGETTGNHTNLSANGVEILTATGYSSLMAPSYFGVSYNDMHSRLTAQDLFIGEGSGDNEVATFKVKKGEVTGDATTKAAFNTWLGTLTEIPGLKAVLDAGSTAEYSNYRFDFDSGYFTVYDTSNPNYNYMSSLSGQGIDIRGTRKGEGLDIVAFYTADGMSLETADADNNTTTIFKVADGSVTGNDATKQSFNKWLGNTITRITA